MIDVLFVQYIHEQQRHWWIELPIWSPMSDENNVHVITNFTSMLLLIFALLGNIFGMIKSKMLPLHALGLS